MILTVDIGNSNIVLGCAQGDKILHVVRMHTDPLKTSDEYWAQLQMQLQARGIDSSTIEGSIIASVVPQVLNSFQTAILKLTGKPSLVVGPGLKTGLNIRIENPNQLGADLVVGAVAALKLYKPPLVVVDMGTATTLVVLDENGTLVGGAICPGVQMSLNALTENTALLPGIQLDKPKRAIGRNTVDCMRSGIMYGTADMLDGLIDRMRKELGKEVTVVCTGGLARFVTPLCRNPMHYEKDLLTQGLLHLYRENKK